MKLRTDIQALRGIAVLLVLLHHTNIHLRAGYLGVDVFFVISGFLITSLVKKSIERGEFSFTDFYFRRAKRLLPAAYVTFVVTALASFVLLTNSELRDFTKQLIGAVSFTGNIALWRQTGYFATSAELKPLLHVWSLAIEEQYYLLLPAALVWCPRRFWRVGAAAVLLLSLALALVVAPRHPSAAFYLLPTRAWELAVGTIGALGLGPVSRIVRVGYWPAVVVVLVLPFVPLGGAHPGADAALICVSTLVIILRNNDAVGNSFPSRVLAWFGDFSYSLYLVHWPVIAFVNNAWIGEVPGYVRAACAIASLGIARLLFLLVEQPARHVSIAMTPRSVAAALAASIAIPVLPIVGMSMSTDGDRYAELRRTNYGLSERCEYLDTFEPRAECRTSSQPRILVWGDSFAMHLVPGIVATSPGIGVEQATRSSCGPLLGIGPVSMDPLNRNNLQWAQSCMRFNESVMRYLEQTSSVEVVVLSSSLGKYVDDGEKWRLTGAGAASMSTSVDSAVEHLKRTITAVRALGKRVIVVAEPPAADFDMGLCQERLRTGKWNAGPLADCSMPLPLYREHRSRVLEATSRTAREAGVSVVRFDDVLCDDKACRTAIGDLLVYRDAMHLSHDGSVTLASYMNLTTKLFSEAQ